ncbi:hypothetical protein GUITHDRAFT_106598 [Guillardia theta CCMP2712]|uniref:Uncharacterized protein n=1 Tax=Guillardia theta (strain CCMP2712) TaxID=905079 RepID=L1JGI6_GUITC|nr:hypothetical protein GUITHDRAFT_106598 [Guillardia theta CCMP2712]EKX47611.1 hypothetical protein GUITHDRAFT_106598 [Guillardia theta CCMP2712]|eukprot:XP_005834591.1 hypothetical protein GUITHDRAFT_106598 [Guillardia theta CCMP2712]
MPAHMHGLQAILLLIQLMSNPLHAAVFTQSGMKYTVAETAQLQMEGGTSDLKATDLKIYWGSLGAWSKGNDILASNTVIEVYLPRFTGGSNLFGAYRSDSSETNVMWMKQSRVITISESISKTWGTGLPVSSQFSFENGPGVGGCFGITQDLSSNAFDLKQLNASSFSMCHWDSQKETLRLLMSSSKPITGVYISKVSMYQNYDVHGKQNGLGPLPPIGGIDEQWYQLANVAVYQALGSLQGCAVEAISDFPSTACTSDLLVYQVPFDQYRSVRFGTDHPPIPTRKGAGGVGTVAPPAFVYAAASGNNDGPNQPVCITVTLISSTTLYSAAVNPTTITLTGLIGSSSASQPIQLFQNKCQCQGSSPVQDLMPARFRTSTTINHVGSADFKADGTLTFQLIPGYYIQAGEVLTFSFGLLTGGNTQVSQELKVSLSGQACLANDFCTSSKSVAIKIPPTPFHSSSRILEVVGKKLKVSMFQSSSDPGSWTNIFVTLRPNFNVEVGSVISIQGLCGTQSKSAYVTLVSNRINGGTPLTDKCTGNPTEVDLADYWPGSRMDWNGGPLKITVASSLSLVAQGTYALSWTWKNLNLAHSACSMTVSMLKAGDVVSAEAVENIGNTVGYVQAPGFIKYKIGQSTTRPDVVNYICVTLRSNFRVSTLSNSQGQNNLAQITISGLQGSQTTTALYLKACPSYDWSLMQLQPESEPPTAHFVDKITGGTLHRTSSWSSGSAVLTVNQDDVANQVYYSIPQQQDIVFALMLKNPKVSNPCQSVTMSFSGVGPGDHLVTQTVSMVQNPVDRALEDGETDGDVCVLKTYDYNFPTRVIAQSTSVVQEKNIITVTLRSNMDLLSSVYSPQITISGLTGTDTTITSLSASAITDQYFPNIQKSSWDHARGELVITLAPGACQLPVKGQPSNCMYAGWTYAWSYVYRNGITEQASPPVSISCQFAQSKLTSPQPMASPMRQDLHVLYLTRKLLNKYDIGQLNPSPGAVNPVCITLRPSKSISAPTTFTLTGLNMFSSGTKVALYDEFGVSPLTSGLFQSVGESPQDNYVTYDKSTIQFQLAPSQSLQQDIKYKFCFQLTNSKTGQTTCPQVSLTVASTSAPAVFQGAQSYLCSNDMTRKVSGYTSEPSGCAGYISDRKFISSNIRSGSNVTGSTVWLTMELQPNYPLASGQTITVGSFVSMKNAGSSDIPCTIVRNAQVVNAVTNQRSKGIVPPAVFNSVCKYIDNTIQISCTGASTQYSSSMYDPFYNLNARRSKGLYKVEVTAGGSGYQSASVIICDVTPGAEFWTIPACTAAGVVFAAGTSASATANVISGAVTSISLTAPGSGYTLPPQVFIVDPSGSGSGAQAEAFIYDHSIYTVQLQLVNQNTAASAQALTVTSGSSFVSATLDSGYEVQAEASLRISEQTSSEVVFTVTPEQNLYEGDMLLVNLPAYDVVTGPIFGVTSSPNPAFTTFGTQLEWELNYHQENRARAYVSNGWVADGNRHRSGDGDVDGLFVLSPDDDGYNKNKDLCWSRVSCPWGLPDSNALFGTSTTLMLTKVTNGASSSLGYTQDICYRNSSINLLHPSDYVGMQLRCRNNQHTVTAGGQVTSVRVRHGGLAVVSGKYSESSGVSGAAPTFVASGATDAATGTLLYQVVGVQFMSGSLLAAGDSIVFDSTYQVLPANATVSSLYNSRPAVHVTASGLYSGYPFATVSGKNTELRVLVTVASARITSQGSGYTAIPSISTSLKPGVALPAAVQQLELPLFDVSLTNVTGTVITQSILDYIPARQCFVVAEEFPTSFLSDCQVAPKEQVGRYTGMTAMIGSNEYVIKQGAGGVYWVTDLKGNKPRSIDLSNKPYTIYTQMQLQVAKGKWIRQGESISISIPSYRFRSVPSDTNAFITRSTDDASKTIKERTRFQFASPISFRNVRVSGSAASRMLLFGGGMSSGDSCTIQGSDIEGPQATDGLTVNNAQTMTTVGGSEPVFAPPSTWGSGYLRPASFSGTCTSSRSLLGVFMLEGQRTGIERIEIVTPGTSCSANVQVTISSPDRDRVTDGLTNTPVCPSDSSLCSQATAVATVSGGSITSIVLTNAGSGYLLAPVVTMTNPSTNTPCDAFAIAHLSHNFTSRLRVTADPNLMMYQPERDHFDSLTGLHSSVFAAVSLYNRYDARKSNAEVGTGYVSAIVVTSLPPSTCIGPITIEPPPSGRTAKARTAGNGGIASIEVIDGGYGYEYPPAVSFPCGGGSARAILGFTTSDVHMAGPRASSYTGMQSALLTSSSKAPAFRFSMDSPVVVGFNKACSTAVTQTMLRAGASWNSSRVTAVTIPQQGVAGFAFGFTSVKISPSAINTNGLVDAHADALAVPTWSFPASGSRLVNGETGIVHYNGPTAVTNLFSCDQSVLVFSPPQRGGGQVLKIKVSQAAGASFPSYEIVQQGQGYANIPIVVDIEFSVGGSVKSYRQDYADLSSSQSTLCKPSFFSLNTAYQGTNVYSSFVIPSGTGAQQTGLTLDGALITREGYGYQSSGSIPIATFSCSGCSSSACADKDANSIANELCTASDLKVEATVSSECSGTCLHSVATSAFFSPSNRDGLQICSPANGAGGDYRTRKTLQMRVSSGPSAYSNSNVYTARRSQGFQGPRGSLIFKITANETFASSSRCQPPRVIVEPPSSGGVQAEVVLDYIDTSQDPYSNEPSASSTAANKGFTADAAPYQYVLRVINAGSGYLTTPSIRVVDSPVSLPACPAPTIGAYPRSGMVASRVELVRNISLPELKQGGANVQPTCSSGAYVVKTLCPGSNLCTSAYSKAELNPLPSCSASSQCSPCATFPCPASTCAADNCPSYLSTVLDASLSSVVADEALASIGWDARTQQPVLLNAGFGFSPSSPNPLRLEFPSDSGQAYPCAEILLYFTDSPSSEALQPGPLYWPGDLSFDQSSVRNLAGQVTAVDYLFRPAFINAVFGSFSSFPVTTLVALRDQSARRLLQTSRSALLIVQSVTGFKVGDYLRLVDEILLVDAISVEQNSLAVTRGALNSSIALTFSAGTVVRTFNPGSVLLQSVPRNATSIDVSNTAKFRSGRYIQVEKEVMYVTAVGASSLTVLRAQGGTIASSHAAFKAVGYVRPSQQYPVVLVEAVTANQTSMSVSDASLFFVGALIKVLEESMAVTSISGNQLTVKRAQEGTSASSYPTQVLVKLTVISPSVNSSDSSGASVSIEGGVLQTAPSIIYRSNMVLLTHLSSSDTVLHVQDPVKDTNSSGFQPGDYLLIFNYYVLNYEAMLVLSVETATVSQYLYQNLTVERGQFQSYAQEFFQGVSVNLLFNPRVLEQDITDTGTHASFSNTYGLQSGDLLWTFPANDNAGEIEVMEYQSDGSVLRGLIPDWAGKSQATTVSAGALVQTVAEPAYLNPPYCTHVNNSLVSMSRTSDFAVGDNVSDGHTVYKVTAIDAASNNITVESLYFAGTPCGKYGFLVKIEGLRLLSSSFTVSRSFDPLAVYTISLSTQVSDFYSPGDFVWIADGSTSSYAMFQVESVGDYSLNVAVFTDSLGSTFNKDIAVLYKYERFDVINGAALSPGDSVLFSWNTWGGTAQVISSSENQVRLKFTSGRYNSDLRASYFEDMFQTFQLLPVSKKSYAKSKLALAVNSSETRVILFDASGFRVGNNFIIDNEIMTIDNINGNLLQVSRAQAGTAAAPHNLGANITWTAPTSTTSSPVSSVTPLTRRSEHLRYISELGSITLPSSILQASSSYQDVWAILDHEIILIRQPALNIVQASDRGLRGTVAAAHVTNTPYNIPNALFSWQFNVRSSLLGSSGFSALPVYSMNAAGVIALSGVHVLSGGSGVSGRPSFQLSTNRFIDSDAQGQSVGGVTYSYRPLIQQTYLGVDLSNKFTQRLIRPNLNYPVTYQPWRFPADPLYFQDRMDGFDPSSDSSLLSHNGSNAINASSPIPFEPGSPVFVLDSFGQMLGDQAVPHQSLSVSDGAAYSYSITSRPSVLDSTWSSPALLIVSTSSATTAEIFFNDTVAGLYSNGQKNALLSSSSRMFAWKTDPRKLAVHVGAVGTGLNTASASSSTSAGGQNIGAIIGGVIAGVVGAALIGFLAYKLIAPKLVAKAVDEVIVPVYLPQAYPALPVDYATAAPMPISISTPVYGQQPLAYGIARYEPSILLNDNKVRYAYLNAQDHRRTAPNFPGYRPDIAKK